MNTFFFIILTLILFILQTVILPSFSWFAYCFDLIIIEIIYICLIARSHTALIPVVLIGAIMDSASGVPFFFYVFSYVWIYIVVQLANQLLFQRSLVFVMVISMIAVFIEQGFLLFLLFLQHGTASTAFVDVGIMVRQLFFGLLFIPSGIWLINHLRVAGLNTGKQIKKQLQRKYKGEL